MQGKQSYMFQYLTFLQTHKVDNNGINASFVFPKKLQFPSSFVTYDVSKCKMRYQWM